MRVNRIVAGKGEIVLGLTINHRRIDNMELADIHNRRANIELVSKRAKEHGYPLLAWPEDRELLRLGDLPVLNYVNIPPDWSRISYSTFAVIDTDEQLRKFIKPGRAYLVQNDDRGNIKAPKRIEEYKVITR